MTLKPSPAPDTQPARSPGWARRLIVVGATALLLSLSVLGGIWLGRRSQPQASPPTASVTGESLNAAEILQPKATAASAETSSRIEVMQNGRPASLPNGGSVTLGDGLQAEVFIAPYPPTGFSADLDLYLTDAGGQPVTDAVVNLEYDMLFMFHGPAKARVTNQKDGHYLTSFDFGMFGSWALDTTIDVPGRGRELSLPLVIYVWP